MLSLGLLILRLGAGGLMAYGHGWGKLEKLQENPNAFADPLGIGPSLSLALAMFAELICAVLVAVGLTTRLASIPLIVTMSVAAFMIHAADPLFGPPPSKEFALLYLAPFATLLFTGPGLFSLDALFWPRLWRQRPEK
jgi:putative oxidoreductase